MRLRPRRIALQITPLVDTLLIVLFLQYVDARQKHETSLSLAAAATRDRDRAAAELLLVQGRHREILQELERAQAGLQGLAAESLAREVHAAEAEAEIERLRAQQRVLGELVTELFRLPQEQLQAVLDPARDPPLASSPAQLEQLRARFREMASSSPGAMIRHLLSYEEVRKRCDLWDLFIDASGIARVDTGATAFQFRVVPDEFEDQFFRRYKSLPQTKDLVIILLSVDRRSQRQFVQPVRAALPRLVDRMRQDSGGRSRFEYADLGVRID